MARRAAALCALTLITQVLGSLASDASTSANDVQGDSLRVAFGFTGVALPDVDTAGLRALIAGLAGVPAAAVSDIRTSPSSATDDVALRAVQVSALIEAINLAAPYAKLMMADTAAEVAAALRSIDATYSPQSLQVDAPAWIVEAAQPAADDRQTVTLRFIMAGVAMPDLDQIRLRAVIGSVAGVRLEDVQIVSVEYAVAAKLGRKLADGYHTLRITAAVDAAAAAGVGNLLVATAAPASLAQVLRAEMGATYRPGSLQVTLPPGNPSSSAASAEDSAADNSQQLQAGLIVGAATVTAAAVFALSAFAVHCYRAKAATAVPPHKHMSDDVEVWANPAAYHKLPASAVVGAQPVQGS